MNKPVEITNSSKPYNALTLAHELRMPLDNIHLSMEMLRTVIPDGDGEIYLDVIMRSAARMDNLINTFLMVPHPTEVTPASDSLHQLLDEVLDIADERITRKQVVVSKEYTAQGSKLVLNKPAMKIALVNIMINAIESMAQDNGQLKLKTKLINDKYVLRIEHNGHNTGDHINGNFFQPYFVNNTENPGPRLITAFYLLRSNFVTIDFESDEDKGTSFNLTFRSVFITP